MTLNTRKFKLNCVLTGLLLSMSPFSQAADLLSVYHDAVNNSPILESDLYANMATGEGVPINVGNILPSLTVSANAGYNQIRATGVNSVSYTNSAYTFTATQILFNYNDFANISVAHYNKAAGNATYESQQQQFIQNVAAAYFNVLTAQYDVRLAEAQYKFLKTTLQQTEAKFSVGLGTYTDVAQAKANYDSAYATLIQNQNNLAIINENLRTFTGKIETNLAMVTKGFPTPSPNPQNVNDWVKIAEQKNPLLVAQRDTENAALANTNAVVGNQLPSVFLQASYNQNFYSSATPSIISSTNHNLDKIAEIGLTWTIFSGGEQMASTLQAADQYVAQENTSTNLYRQTVSQTTQDYLSVMADIAQIKAYQQSVISAESSLKEFDAKYKVGSATIVDVLNEVQTLYQARFNLAQAMNNYVNSDMNLKLDIGALSVTDLQNMNKYLKVPATPTVQPPSS